MCASKSHSLVAEYHVNWLSILLTLPLMCLKAFLFVTRGFIYETYLIFFLPQNLYQLPSLIVLLVETSVWMQECFWKLMADKNASSTTAITGPLMYVSVSLCLCMCVCPILLMMQFHQSLTILTFEVGRSLETRILTWLLTIF